MLYKHGINGCELTGTQLSIVTMLIHLIWMMSLLSGARDTVTCQVENNAFQLPVVIPPRGVHYLVAHNARAHPTHLASCVFVHFMPYTY
ncbi:MAG TPA: hypothetical protein EYP10_13330 [Armatimonadetes bacterium]|nr:hypothetical protein [Armatimonadota bacterium]